MYRFAEGRQNAKKEKLTSCLDKAHDIKTGKDVVSNFFICYEDLIKDYTDLEEIVAKEFSNII
jgi:hypothetical protein